jgi:microcystin-dependent protein
MKRKKIATSILMILTISFMMTFNKVQTFASVGDQFIGEIHLMSFNFAPKGWALCRGQTLNISQNQALFSLLGTQFGGDGVTTFALPNLEAAELQMDPVYGVHYYIALQGVFPSRN